MNFSIFDRSNGKLPIIRQVENAECGHACVIMLANYYGHHLDLNGFREKFPPSPNGTTLLDIVKMLEFLQLKARALKVDISEISHLTTPAIIHWNMNHFVVLKKITPRYFVIHDPAIGIRKVSYSEFLTSFTGIVLEVEKAEEFKPISSSDRLKLKHLFSNVKGLKSCFFVLFILSITIETLVLINPFFLQYVMDGVSTNTSMSNLYVVSIGFVIVTIIHSFTEFIRSNYVVFISNKMSEHFSSSIINHMLHLPLGYFERRQKGDILSRFNSIREIQNKVTIDSINTLLDGIVVIMAIIIMGIYSVTLTLIVILSLCLYLAIRIFSYNYLKNQSETSIGEHANVSSKILEIIQSILPIKLFGKENVMYRSWKNYYVKAMNADIKVFKAGVIYNTANIFLFNLEHILVICFGAILVVENKFSVGMLIAFLAYRQMLVTKSNSFIQKLFEYKLISIQVNRVSDIILQEREVNDKYDIERKEFKGDICVDNLTYSYPSSKKPVVHNLTFNIKGGEKVVITGKSGIGKTTLVKIMLGLIEPNSGEILIDGVSLKFLGLRRYRSLCATVMQDDSLVAGSLLDNITFFDAKIDIDKVYRAAKIAQIHDDIMNMTMGYETIIGELGSTLSGGQKQRVLLARALYKEPTILFLDEATSHLDVDTEIKINTSLKELNITQVVIAHRQETIDMADRVIDLSCYYNLS